MQKLKAQGQKGRQHTACWGVGKVKGQRLKGSRQAERAICGLSSPTAAAQSLGNTEFWGKGRREVRMEYNSNKISN